MLLIYFRIVYRIKVTGIENIPRDGGVVLCANHQSIKDPIIVGILVKRRVSFMAKKELFKNKIVGLVLKGIDVFPVERNSTDLKAYKKAIKLLKKGKALGIFAQGTRSSELDVSKGKSGAVFFALSAGVPIVPIGIRIEKSIFSKIYLNCGEAIYYDEQKGKKIKTELLDELTSQLMVKIDLCVKGK